MITSFLLMLVLFLVCPNGIVNITGSTTGTLAYPSSGNYGINETKCWRIEVPKPYVGIAIYFHRYSFCPGFLFVYLNTILSESLRTLRSIEAFPSSSAQLIFNHIRY